MSYPSHFKSLEAFLQHCEQRSQSALDMYGPEAPISDSMKMWAERYNHDVRHLLDTVRHLHSEKSEREGLLDGTFLNCPLHNHLSPTAEMKRTANGEYYIRCYACRNATPFAKTESEAVLAWRDM